jgi:HEAT repeat protein
MERLISELVNVDPPDAELYKLSNVHGEALDGLKQAWPSLPAERRQSVVARLIELAESDFEVDFTELLRICLDDESARVRTLAVEGLWEVEDVSLVRPIVRLLQSDPAIPVREAAAIALSRFALQAELGRLQPRSSDSIWNALSQAFYNVDEDLSVRRRAVESMAYFDRPETTQAIAQAYADEESKMRVSAVFAMGRSVDQEWANTVMTELETEDPEMRYEATRACGALQLIEATAPLSVLVADDDPEVRLTAVWSLGQIGTPEARRVLEICIEQGDEALRDAAEDALDEIDFMDGALDFPLYDLDPDGPDVDEIFWTDEDGVD